MKMQLLTEKHETEAIEGLKLAGYKENATNDILSQNSIKNRVESARRMNTYAKELTSFRSQSKE
jgi:hypothetical protein